MAKPGDEIKGVSSTIRFVETTAQTGGEYLLVEIAYDGDGRPPPPHFHPNQDERFEVLEGEIHARLDDEPERVVRAGETLLVPAGTVHQMWASAPARQRWETRPALNTERFFETLWGFQRDTGGLPGPTQMALSLRHFSDEFRVLAPPPVVQRLAFPVLAGVARLRGLEPERPL